MIRSGLYAGSFDPFTCGHFCIIERAAPLLDRLVIGVVKSNDNKPFAFSVDERIEMIRHVTKHHQGIEVVPFDGLVVDFAKQINVDVLIRGLRDSIDIDYEFQMASCNRQLTGIETLFLLSSSEYTHLSSSLVREIGRKGGSLQGFVPESILDRIQKKFK